MWSDILPRLHNSGWLPDSPRSQEKLEGVRVSINDYARRQTNKLRQASIITHRGIKASSTSLFINSKNDKVHLSDLGEEILLQDFEGGLQAIGYSL